MTCPSRPWRPSMLVAAALLALAAGCDEPTAVPSPTPGTFVLRTVGDEPLPAVTGVALDTEFWVLAETVVLRPDGTGEWRSTTSRRNIGTGVRDTTRTVRRFQHSRNGPVIRASAITCEPLCDALPTTVDFVLDGDWLLRGPSLSLYRYERVPTYGFALHAQRE